MVGESAGSEKDFARMLSNGTSIVSDNRIISRLSSSWPGLNIFLSLFMRAPPYHTPVPVRRLLMTWVQSTSATPNMPLTRPTAVANEYCPCPMPML